VETITTKNNETNAVTRVIFIRSFVRSFVFYSSFRSAHNKKQQLVHSHYIYIIRIRFDPFLSLIRLFGSAVVIHRQQVLEIFANLAPVHGRRIVGVAFGSAVDAHHK